MKIKIGLKMLNIPQSNMKKQNYLHHLQSQSLNKSQKKIYDKSVEAIKEEIEREEDRKKKLYKSNFIRTKENNKNKKTLKYKNKKYYGEKRNYIKESDNIISIYDFKNVKNEIGTKDDILHFGEGDNETTKIKKLTEKKKINADDYTETLTSRKEYKLHKTSTVIAPLKK